MDVFEMRLTEKFDDRVRRNDDQCDFVLNPSEIATLRAPPREIAEVHGWNERDQKRK
jgi:hypothetical protein